MGHHYIHFSGDILWEFIGTLLLLSLSSFINNSELKFI